MIYTDYLQARSQDLVKSSVQVLDDVASASASTMLGIVGAVFVIFAVFKIFSILLREDSLKSSQVTKNSPSHRTKRDINIKDNYNGSHLGGKKDGEATMEISQLWVYPIKALRGCQLSTATVTKEGFTYDRKFVLLKDLEKTPREFQHIAVTKFPRVCLFHTSIQGNILTVRYHPPGATGDDIKYLEIPLEPPNFQKSEKVAINMHSSPSIAYDMGQHYNQWFSDIFGFKVVLAYWGGNPRQVLGNLPGKPSNVSQKQRTFASKILSQIPLIRSILNSDDWGIAFNDVAPFLIITEESAAEVTTRLPDGVEVDITKFRSNIVLKNSSSAYVEDFWGELVFGDDTKLTLTANCGRCISLNVDYHTGESGTGRDGKLLKLLSSDRRVDEGTKYSPIFGRYGFPIVTSEGKELSVGDEVVVTKKNKERTRFYWPGLA